MRHCLMRSFIAVVLLSLVSAAPAATNGLLDQPHLPSGFEFKTWRQMYLELAASPAPIKTQVSPAPPAGSRQALLIDFFQAKIEPKMIELGHLNSQYHGLMLLVDSGLFTDPSERDQWSARMSEILSIFGAQETDEVWQNNVLQFGKLAEGLSGELADLARRMAEKIELESYPPKMKAEVEELFVTEQQISETASQLPSKDRALAVDQEVNKVLEAYFTGQMGFAEAAKKVEELSNETGPKIGAELIGKVGNKLQRTAVLRSQLAQAKGFKTWAELQVARQASSHGEGLKTAPELLKFLYDLLDATDNTARRVYETAAASVGRKIESLRPAEMRLLMKPAEFLIYGYFPKERDEPIWRETMKASGFSDDLTRRVIVDPMPRENKQGHAYMMPAQMVTNLQPVLDGQSLNFEQPIDSSPLWQKPVTAIVQNFTDDDIGNLRTMFHEGGHGIDFAAQRPDSNDNDSYGYVETHSTTLEHFMLDEQFISHYAINRDGKRPLPETVKQYIRESSIGELMGFRGNVMQAIFDLELWNYDYNTKSATTLWKRAIDLSERLVRRVRFVALPKDRVVPTGKSFFATSHFYSGNVRYFGYVLADVSAEMVANHLLDRLEASSGRRSLFQQPQIAEMLTQLYRQGPKQQFPQSIESFTGKKFSAQAFARGLTERVNAALDTQHTGSTDCDQQLLK